MQIHELNNFAGTPTSSDYLAIDNSTTTTKIGATGLGIQTQMTVAEATTGTSTSSRVITPKVLHDYVGATIPDAMTVAEATAGTSTSTRVITPKVLHDYYMTVTSDSDTWNGCTVLYGKYGRVVTIKLSGSTTNQITSTNGGELTIRNIPTAYKPKNPFVERKLITGSIQAQVQATASGELKLGYSQNVANNTGTNIPSGSNIRIEMCYISAS